MARNDFDGKVTLQYAGRSIQDMLWEELFAIYERLVTKVSANPDIDKGQAQGVAFAIATMRNPHRPDVIAVSIELKERWNESQ